MIKIPTILTDILEKFFPLNLKMFMRKRCLLFLDHFDKAEKFIFCYFIVNKLNMPRLRYHE
jgi:hypothetical protein